MNEHKKINRLLADFALGELSSEAQTEIKAHLSVCPQCASELKRLEAVLESAERIRELSADARTCESAKQAVFTAVEGEKMRTASMPHAGMGLVWRTAMASPITKLATAAVVIIA